MKKKKLIVANWKMNPASAAEARVLFSKTKLAGRKLDSVETVICPPFPYLGLFVHGGTTRVSLGTQDVFWANSARATGEVSPEMLKDIGVSYIIVGHSERRTLGESDEIVSKKLKAVLTEGLTPILCVGEKERDADGRYFESLKNQIKASCVGLRSSDFRALVIAYEPLWAIGKSAREAMQPGNIREMAIFIQKVLSDAFGEEAARVAKLLYGGSVEEGNTNAILTEGGVNGLLVGHASLDAAGFTKILKIANAI
ncbi:MAG: triose-phosphate isomerase [bacterium]|nr:triose-phosphate isomerase [bacterium]